MKTHMTVAVSVLAVMSLAGCAKPPCEAGELPAEWSKAPLDDQVPSGEKTTCKGATATEATFWVKKKVHDANMASVSRAQDNGWSRLSDNWYGTKGDFNSPKWSEFGRKDGKHKLRVEVKEAGGGATIVVKLTPGG